MATFTWKVSANPNEDTKPRVTNIKFGDGYTQRFAFGINTMPTVWSIQFSNREEIEANEIRAFFIQHGGITSFDWTPPGSDVSKKFICQEWSRVVHNGEMYTINGRFEEVFDL